MPEAMLSAYALLTMSVPLVGAFWIVPLVRAIEVMSVFAPSAAAPSAVRAAPAVLAPVPPLPIASVPPSVKVPAEVMGEPLNVRPVVPPDAATEVTVPANWSFDVMVKLGYVPLIDVVPAPVRETIRSGAVLFTVKLGYVPLTLIAVPAVRDTI